MPFDEDHPVLSFGVWSLIFVVLIILVFSFV
jgi:hypothetical protein